MASFEIVEVLVGGKTRPVDVGIFPDGKTASSIIASLKLQSPDKTFQPRPIKDETEDWRAREQRRFDEGVYEALGIDLKPVKDHFAHRSVKEKANVAYTADNTGGVTDKQVSIHINTYLNRFFPKLTIEERRKLVWEYCGEDVSDGFAIATTAEEIVRVYTNGPSSCMSGGASEWNGLNDHHPVEAYAGGDLAVAYIQDGKRVTARAVVWPEKKIYYNGYGDTPKLTEALKLAGYTRVGYGKDFYGARLSKIEVEEGQYWSEYDDEYVYRDGGYLCPYLDMASAVKIQGDYLVICDRYDEDSMDAQNTGGSTDS